MYHLDEIPTGDMFKELERRIKLLEANKCPYCEELLENHTCKYNGKVAEIYLQLFEIQDLSRKLIP